MGAKAFEEWMNEAEATSEAKQAALPTSRDEEQTFRQKLGSGNIGAFIDNAAQAITGGTADEAKAKLYSLFGSGDYDTNLEGIRQHSAELDRDHKAASIGGSLAGSILGGIAMPGLKGAATVAGVAGRGAANAGVQSMLTGFGEGEGGFTNRLKEGGIQGLIGTVTGGVLGTLGGAITSKGRLAKTATLQKTGKDLRQLTNDAYDAADQAGVVYNGNDIVNELTKSTQDIRSNGYFNPAVNKKDAALSGALDDILDSAQSQTTTGGLKPRDMKFSELESMRKNVKSRMATNKDPRLMGVIKGIDRIIDSNAQGSELAAAAREASRVERNTKLFDQLVDKANINATANDTSKIKALRASAARMLTSPKTSPFLDDEEKAVLQSVLKAGHTSDFERFVARYDPSTSHYASLASAIWVMNHPLLGIAGSAAGYGARKLGEKGAESAISGARNVISGSNIVPPLMDMGTGGAARGTASAAATAAAPLATNLYQNLMNNMSGQGAPAWNPNE